MSHILCCLGNPGAKYAGTRHNAGFMVADFIAGEHNIKINRLKFHGVYGELVLGQSRVIILKPQTFMNNSGLSAKQAAEWYKIPADRLIVICDDLDLPCGKIRVRAKGSDGGHKGLKSILYHLGTDAFPRIRIGIGKPENPDYPTTDWVLGRFSGDERIKIESAVRRAAAAAFEIVSNSVESAANLYNGV